MQRGFARTACGCVCCQGESFSGVTVAGSNGTTNGRLHSNKMGDAGAIAIAKALELNRSVTELRLVGLV